MHLLSVRSGLRHAKYSYEHTGQIGRLEQRSSGTHLVIQLETAPVRFKLFQTVFTHLVDSESTYQLEGQGATTG